MEVGSHLNVDSLPQDSPTIVFEILCGRGFWFFYCWKFK